jgi:hypothetical protein
MKQQLGQQMEDITTNPMPLGKAQTRTIRGVEIFASGVHNSDVYTERDLDDMVAAFRELDFKPALKLGHSADKPGDPAFGWVENIKRAGSKLLADFVGLHESVYKAIKERAYDRCSAEIYHGLKRGGKVFRRALKAVALLGAEVPAVAGLTPLHKMEFVAATDYGSVAACVHAFALAEERPSVELDRRVREHMRAREGWDYESSLEFVLEGDSDLVRAYAEEQGGGARAEDPSANAGDEVDEKVRARLDEGKSKDYDEAMDAVLADDQDLARRYDEQQRGRRA